MRQLLILCRHGNTFNPGEKVVMVGASQDLVLTPVGKAQALAVGQALKRLSISPQQIITGPLKRTREFADIIAEILAIPLASIQIEQRLTELDYGAWGGLSEDEISERWGSESLRRWQEDADRPSDVEFVPSQSQLEKEARELLRDVAVVRGVTVAVTSNGRLRELARLVSGAPSKVKTGHLCVLEYTSQDGWTVLNWNSEPAGLSL